LHWPICAGGGAVGIAALKERIEAARGHGVN
jgi:hypothetical protein